MKRLFISRMLSLTTVLLLTSTLLFSQEMKIQRETTGSSSASSTILLNDTEYLVQESIGQASVIGTYFIPKTELRQGFLQPMTLRASYPNKKKNSIIVYPNPFRSSIYIEMKELLHSDVHLYLVDAMGRIVYEEEHYSFNTLNLDLHYLKPGSYFLRINTASQQYSAQIQKL